MIKRNLKKWSSRTALILGLGLSLHAVAEEQEQLSFSANMCARSFASYNQDNGPTMFDFCRASAEDGDMISSALLGQIYMYGFKGVPQEPNLAYKWTKIAADKGHIPSIAEVGKMKLIGFGTEEDFEGAGKLIDEALDKRSGAAAYYKSIWYLNSEEHRPNELMSFEERMTKVCEMNLIAVDYGYTSKRAAFNELMESLMKESHEAGVSIADTCIKNVKKYHIDHKDQFLYSNAGRPVQKEYHMPDGPYPINSPQFWLNIIAPKK